MTIRGFIIFLSVLLALASMQSCHSSKKAYAGDVGLSASSADAEHLYEALTASYSDWTSIYAPIHLALEAPKNMSVSGRATMVYGKEIFISLRMIGMEVAQIYIDDEYIYVVDKFHKCYFKEDLQTLLKGMGWKVSDIQDMLLGRPVLPGTGILKSADIDEFSFLSSDDRWILSPNRQFKGADWHYIASRTDPPLLTSVYLRLKDGTALQWEFDEPTNTPAGIVDGVSMLTVPYKDNDLVVSITMDLSKAEWDTDRQANFTPPSAQYKLLDMEALIKAADSF